MKSKKYVYLFLFGFLMIGMFLVLSAGKKYDGIEAMVYKAKSCGCCGNYIPFLKSAGFKLKVISLDDVSQIKRENGVREDYQSCHTVLIGDYFVEGHVPLAAVEKLLDENPDVDGIVLPNMPAGSPGMPGIKRGDFVIYSVKDGNVKEFMRI